MSTPLPVISCARVLRYAVVDDSVTYLGNKTLFVDGELLGRVPKLAICKYKDEDDTLLFHCDEEWAIQGVSAHESLEEAEKHAERMYRGITGLWIDPGISEEEAESYLDKLFEGQVCSFCAKRPDQARQLFGQGRGHICDECVLRFHEMLVEEGPADEEGA